MTDRRQNGLHPEQEIGIKRALARFEGGISTLDLPVGGTTKQLIGRVKASAAKFLKLAQFLLVSTS
jgi:hypothetical protein